MKYTFLEFTDIVRGYNYYTPKGFQIFKYELYWSKVDPEKLINGLTKYKKIPRER